MSETATEAQDGNNSGETSAADEFKAPASQEELNRIIAERVKRAEAKYADYKDVKAKAAQLDSLSEASKSELERATETATKAAAERDDARAEALRLRIAVEHGISIEDADLFLTGKDEESLRAQAKRLSDREAGRKANNNVVPNEGTSTRPAENEEARFARSLFSPAGD